MQPEITYASRTLGGKTLYVTPIVFCDYNKIRDLLSSLANIVKSFVSENFGVGTLSKYRLYSNHASLYSSFYFLQKMFGNGIVMMFSIINRLLYQ